MNHNLTYADHIKHPLRGWAIYPQPDWKERTYKVRVESVSEAWVEVTLEGEQHTDTEIRQAALDIVTDGDVRNWEVVDHHAYEVTRMEEGAEGNRPTVHVPDRPEVQAEDDEGAEELRDPDEEDA